MDYNSKEGIIRYNQMEDIIDNLEEINKTIKGAKKMLKWTLVIGVGFLITKRKDTIKKAIFKKGE